MRLIICLLIASLSAAAPGGPPVEERIHAAWLGQILGTLMGFQFEHKTASVERVESIPGRAIEAAPVDDDYYYELVALRAFERYGPSLTIEQLGRQWLENNAGTWGASKHARLNMERGIAAAEAGSPRYNPMWFSIGPQFSADIYGMLAPGRPNLAAHLARRLGAINGHAEGLDGGVFVAGMVSLAFVENRPDRVVEGAAQLVAKGSSYRECLDEVISMARAGKSFREVADAVERRWHRDYPATNNAVANGGLTAASVWFGQGDFLETVNLAFAAGDFTDADCNAANAGAVVGSMKGLQAIPPALREALHDRIKGEKLGDLPVRPAVDEPISGIARRIAVLAPRIAAAHPELLSPRPRALPLQRFKQADLMQWWNPEWSLERAGFGGGLGGMTGLRGATYLDGETLVTWPEAEARGLLLRRKLTPKSGDVVSVEIRADQGRHWQLEIYAGNQRILGRLIDENWQTVSVPLDSRAGKPTEIRIYQRINLTGNLIASSAHWRRLTVGPGK
ncbi:MAG: ADP-ribosylglycohydrolase family protein [Bryobacteraceae bacterium]|nr:ADP-ribosylglycohydrolase family protein [Bryobacteraceae bacterium]